MRLTILTILPLLSILVTRVSSQEIPKMIDGMEVIDTEGWTKASKFKQQVLDTHNEARKERNASALSWDDDLAKEAKKWVEKCIWAHSDADNGENLATNYASPNSSVAAWIVEEEDYDASEAKFSKQTGHFTQVVWKETERVGCAAKDCGDPEEEIEEDGPARGWYLACQYSPQGNVKGQFKENVEKVGDSGVAGRGVGVAGVGLMVLGLTVAGLVGL